MLHLEITFVYIWQQVYHFDKTFKILGVKFTWIKLMNSFYVVQLLLWEAFEPLQSFFFLFLEWQKQFKHWPEFGVTLSMTSQLF